VRRSARLRARALSRRPAFRRDRARAAAVTRVTDRSHTVGHPRYAAWARRVLSAGMTPRLPPAVLDPELAAEAATARETRVAEPGIPAWVRHVDQAAWVTGPDRRIRWMNRQAETLLGLRAGESAGRPCHSTVCARDGSGRPFCVAVCPVAARAARHEPVAAHDVVVGPRGPRERWARFTSIPVEAADGTWIVHLASDIDRDRRAAVWMERVAARSEAIRAADPRRERTLTPRENEILDLLADDVELPRIAHVLGISKATARNHVQRLLAALGAHSVQEAVALRLLRRA
jgi:DNA-binding CsgD family transcriptional regulator/PAS domain-containing protein